MTVPILTYNLTQQCGLSRPFCNTCVNSFTVFDCGLADCSDKPPSTICLHPRFAQGPCELCGTIGPLGLNTLLFPSYYPSDWNGSFSLNPIGECQWFRELPYAFENGTYQDALRCPNPYPGKGELVGYYEYTGSISVVKGGLTSFGIFFQKFTHFVVTTDPVNPACSYNQGDRIFLFWLSEVKSLGTFTLGEECHGVFPITPFDPPADVSALSVVL